VDYALITITALVVSGLTLFSGFGLGTVLMPAFALFFPVPVAVAATAVVHLANNLFKLALVGALADRRTVLRFGVPAAFAALVGASALVLVSGLAPLATYELFGRVCEVTAVKLLIGGPIVAFALLELSPAFAVLSIPSKYLIYGGLVSGFFGGLSGNQGAFRSAFLIKSGLGKDAFVATGVVSAVIVDTVRLFVYGLSYVTESFEAMPGEITGLVVAATFAAFVGAYVGTRLLKKVTLRTVQIVVALTMIAIGMGLASGWV
jgi:uncharacterized membrane protein YfcA